MIENKNKTESEISMKIEAMSESELMERRDRCEGELGKLHEEWEACPSPFVRSELRLWFKRWRRVLVFLKSRRAERGVLEV